ncbi:hypothetical protein AGMMS50293_05270 [Spirochaetia bacterium]|nr:hypothetical protein AGMMS50293_05270 [Spirochaetia bacterium]
MAIEYNIRGRKVTIDEVDGEVFVDGNRADLRKGGVFSGSVMWMSRGGTEIKELQGKTLEEALIYKGKI